MKTHFRTTSLAAVAMGGLLAVLPAGGAWARSSRHAATRAPSATQFMKQAALGGIAEVRLGKLATEHAASADVKDFGTRMADDHAKANDDLERVATRKKVTLPDDLDAQHRATYDRLAKLSGAAFDRAYVSEMLKDHRTDVAEFKKATTSSDPDVKAFASRTLPTLEDHLQRVEQLAARER